MEEIEIGKIGSRRRNKSIQFWKMKSPLPYYIIIFFLYRITWIKPQNCSKYFLTSIITLSFIVVQIAQTSKRISLWPKEEMVRENENNNQRHLAKTKSTPYKFLQNTYLLNAVFSLCLNLDQGWWRYFSQ